MRPLRIPMLICAICLISAPALATSSRVASMGGGDDYFEDVNNVLRWYGSLASYGGTALFEFGDGASNGSSMARRSAAVIAELGPDAAWGVGGLFVFGNDPDDVLRLAWGKRFGKLQLGAQWRLHWDRRVFRNYVIREDVDYYYEDQDFGLGGRLELGAMTYLDAAVDLSQTYRHISTDDLGSFSSLYDKHTFTGRMRLFHGLSERTAIVPQIAYERYLHPEYTTYQDNFYDQDFRRYIVGLGWNHLPDSDTMLVGSFTYRYNDIQRRNPRLDGVPVAVDYTNNNYTLRFGLERRMASWITLRAGVWQTLWNQDREQADAGGLETELTESGGEDMELTLGVAIHFGPFDADLVFQDDAPFNFGSFISQSSEYSNSTWNKITLQYVF